MAVFHLNVSEWVTLKAPQGRCEQLLNEDLHDSIRFSRQVLGIALGHEIS